MSSAEEFVAPKNLEEHLAMFPDHLIRYLGKHWRVQILRYSADFQDAQQHIALETIRKKIIERYDPAKRGGRGAVGLYLSYLNMCWGRIVREWINGKPKDAMKRLVDHPDNVDGSGLDYMAHITEGGMRRAERLSKLNLQRADASIQYLWSARHGIKPSRAARRMAEREGYIRKTARARRVTRICDECGKDYSLLASVDQSRARVNRGGGRFCSKGCAMVGRYHVSALPSATT